MADDLGGADGAEPRAFLEILPLRETVQKARCEQIAGAGGVDYLRYLFGRNFNGLLARRDDGALFAQRRDGDLAMQARMADGGIEILRLIKRQ